MSFEVLDVSPPALTSIEADEVLSFDVRGTDPFGLVTIAVKFPRQVTRELAFCSDPALSTSFEEAYSGSTVESVVDGGYVRWRFTLRRNNIAFSPENPDEPEFKWPGTPTISIISEGGSTVVGPAGPTGPTGPKGTTGRPGKRGGRGQRGPVGRITPVRIPDQTVMGNDSNGTYTAYPITVHQELDWIISSGLIWLFDGVDDNALVGNALRYERTNPFSVSFWITPGEWSGSVAIISNANAAADHRGWTVYCQRNSPTLITARFKLINTHNVVGLDIDVQADINIYDGLEHHVCFTYSGNSSLTGVTAYIDNVVSSKTNISSGTTLSTTIVGTGNLRIGAFGDATPALNFPGLLRHVSVWDKALSAGEVSSVYGGGTPPNLSGLGFVGNLDAWWKFDAVDTTAASGIIDYGPSGFHASAQNGLGTFTGKGLLPVRNTSLWSTISPDIAGKPLLTNGLGALPKFDFLTDAGISTNAAIQISKLATAVANTITGNWTAATAAHTDNAVGTNTVVGRVAGNIVAAALVDAQVSASAGIQLSKLAVQGANTVVVNATAGSAVPTALSIGTNAVLGRVAGNIVAAALVNAQITANTITHASEAQPVANTIVGNWTAATANLTDNAVGTNTVVGRVAGNIVAAALVNAQIAVNTITAASQAQMAANTIKANPTAALANESDLAVGTNTVVGRVAGNIVAAALVDAQIAANTISNASRAQMAANTIKANATAGTANEADFAIGTNSVLGRVAGNIVAAALVDAQVDAAAAIVLSKLANGAANTITGNWTAGSAAHTDNAVGTNTVVGRQGGNIVAAQLVDAQITTNTISNASRAQMAANTIKANATAGTANEADLSVGTNTVVGRVGGNIVAAALVDAQVDAAAAIVISKLADAASNTLMGNWTGSSGAHTDNSVGTNTVVGRVAGNIVAAALVNAQVDAAAAIDLSKLANGAALSVVGRSANSSGAHADITAVAASDAVLRESGSTIGFGTIAAGGLSDAIISPIKLATLTSSVGAVFTIYASFAAGAGGSPDDVTVYNANAPFAFRILKTLPYVTTAVAASTLEARDTSGGGGAALSSLFDADVQTEDPAINTPISASTTVAANGSLFIRRSDSGIAGEMVFLCVRT